MTEGMTNIGSDNNMKVPENQNRDTKTLLSYVAEFSKTLI